MSAAALASRVLRWPVYPKMHASEHLFRDFLGHNKNNPRHTSTYLDEDLNGKLKSLGMILEHYGTNLV